MCSGPDEPAGVVDARRIQVDVSELPDRNEVPTEDALDQRTPVTSDVPDGYDTDTDAMAAAAIGEADPADVAEQLDEVLDDPATEFADAYGRSDADEAEFGTDARGLPYVTGDDL